MRVKTLVLLAVVALPVVVLAQSDASPEAAPINGEQKKKTKITLSGTIAGKPKCDRSGNVYFKPYTDELGAALRKPSTFPVRRFGPGGTMDAIFDFFRFLEMDSVNFFVADDGSVHFAGASRSEPAVFLMSFGPSAGTPKSSVKLQSEYFFPYQLAVFPSGEILASGIYGQHNRSIFTGVFDASGKLLRQLREPEDEVARSRADMGEPGFRSRDNVYGNDFVIQGDAAIGPDGNAYLLRSTGLVYVISKTGTVLRKLQLEPPAPGMFAARLITAHDQIALSFEHLGRYSGTVAIYDYEGKAVGTYPAEDPETYAGMLACYDAQGSTYVSVGDGSRTLYLNRVPH